jgi:hypothetical protein
MRQKIILVLIESLKPFILLLFFSCNHDPEIVSLLKSDQTNEVILGAFKAGESGDDKFVPLLLGNCDDSRTSTSIQFKGFSVYQEKMIALRKIYKKEPPVKITRIPDSVVIKFYIQYSKKH